MFTDLSGMGTRSQNLEKTSMKTNRYLDDVENPDRTSTLTCRRGRSGMLYVNAAVGADVEPLWRGQT